MTPARSPDPAAEAVSVLREAITRTLDAAHMAGRLSGEMACILIAGPLAPLLADIAALRTRAEEAEKHLLQAFTSSWPTDVIDHKATTADRDRLAEENARLRAALAEIADQCPATSEMTVAHDMADTAARALDTATGEKTNGNR